MKRYLSIKNLLLSLIICSISFGSLLIAPQRTNAILGVADTVIVVGNTSPTEILNTANGVQNTINVYLDKIKNWVLDGLAWHIAKMFVQRITASVVQWINSGFSGSPSFLTNPGGFFADLGDQITGSFIANTGILSGLCSPFNVDVRLSIALGRAGYGQVEKYTCTLSSVIRNVKDSTINGASIDGFMKGDYRQGGFPAFVEINLPTNNASGAFLKAQSDLNARIASKQGQKQEQLLQGSGFLSWDSCKEVSEEGAASAVGEAGNSSDIGSFTSFQDDVSNGATPTLMAQKNKYMTGEGTSIESQVDPKTGQIKYQDCHTETPGSVIEGQLNHILPSGADALNLADSINEIVDALIGQLINQVLQTGLGSVSSKSSGITQSYIEQLSAATEATSTYSTEAQNIKNEYSARAGKTQELVGYRQQAVDAFDDAIYDYGYAQKCYQNLLATKPAYPATFTTNKMMAEDALASIASELSDLYAAKKPYDDKLTEAKTTLASLQEQANSTSAIASPEDLQKASDQLKQSSATYSPTLDINGLKDSIEVAESIAKSYDKKAKQHENNCQALKQSW